MKRRGLWAALAVIGLVTAACSDNTAGTTTTGDSQTTTTEAAPVTTAAPETTIPAEAELGSVERPIQVVFVPTADAQVITPAGEVMDQALTEATGLEFEMSVPASYPAAVDAMCASTTDTMGFIPGIGYVVASDLCDIEVAAKAVRAGHGVHWIQFLVLRDSETQSIADLAGTMIWAVPDIGSATEYLVPLVQLADAGITIPETNILEAGSHANAALAVYRGEADFATTFYLPPITEPPWAIGDPPDVPEELVESCAPTPEEELWCGDNYRVLDARASATTEAPDIVQAVRILEISPGIPNDTLSFGRDFPKDLRIQVVDALVALSAECATDENCVWNTSIGSEDLYGWTGIEPATDAEYDPLRAVVEVAGLGLDDLD